MNKENYIKYTNNNLKGTSKKIMLNAIESFYSAQKEFKLKPHTYNIGGRVFLKKGTLLHGTYLNIEALKTIVKEGLLSSWFTGNRKSKYPSSVGVWNLKKDYYLDEYINFYSGGTIKYNNMNNDNTKTAVIPYNEIKNLMEFVSKSGFHRWYLEQTKEARFLPSLVQNIVQIGIIFNSDNKYIKEIKKFDILSKNINDKNVKNFVNEHYIKSFIKERKKKDDFFTDRESAILFGIPSCFIEGILVGRKYEKNKEILNKIKKLVPNAYICNLDGKVIKI